MKKPRSISQLQECLDDEFAWRRVEIHEIKREIKSSKDIRKKTLLRAAVPLVYAHWEGFIKAATSAYVSYITSTGRQFGELKPCFLGIPSKNEIALIQESKKPFSISSAVQSILRKQKEKAIIDFDSYFKKIGNINHELFIELLKSLDLYSSKYDSLQDLIDEGLLATRNRIAHGDYLLIDEIAFEQLTNEVVLLLRDVKTDIENCASLASYCA